jgi:integrase/recombinase XerD
MEPAKEAAISPKVSSSQIWIPASSNSKRQKMAETLLNVLEGRIANLNTRQAYKVAWLKFFSFCSEFGLELDRVKPYHFELWRKRHKGGVATQRQHLAAIRLLFDKLLENGLIEVNPAARAKVPRLKRRASHTTIFEEEEVKAFLGGIQMLSMIDLRDKALFTTMIYTWSRVSAVIALKVENYYLRQKVRWLRLNEKAGNIHEVPVHAEARQAIDRWLLESGLGEDPQAPLFPAFSRNRIGIEYRHMTRNNIYKLVQTRARAAGLKKVLGCHSFRATGLTCYMNAGGQLDIAQRIAGHAQPSTTQIYDRSRDRVTVAEIQRVSFEGRENQPASGTEPAQP